MISNPNKKTSSDKPERNPDEATGTVRGSGFTYTEKKERTDKSIPVSEVDEDEVVQLPDLGKKNRP